MRRELGRKWECVTGMSREEVNVVRLVVLKKGWQMEKRDVPQSDEEVVSSRRVWPGQVRLGPDQDRPG